MQNQSKLSPENIDMKMTLIFKRKYKKKLEEGKITQKQYDEVIELIKNRKNKTEKEFNERLIEIFPESEEGIRQVMG